MTALNESVSPEVIAPAETLEEKVDRLIESHDRILLLLSDITGQITPVMEQISNGPIGKLLGVKNG